MGVICYWVASITVIGPEQTRRFPPWLLTTYEMLRSAFPQGVPDGTYWPLLALLGQNMAQRALADVLALYTGKEYATVYNDVLRVQSATPDGAEMDKMERILAPHGYQDWLREEE
jgi:hypothetical protein